MIRYKDYSGPQSDVVKRGSKLVGFDFAIARQMAHHAHLLATDAGPKENRHKKR